jgi:lysophospholipase L1-like esterase
LLLLEGANDLNNNRGAVNRTITETVSALEDMVRDTTSRGVAVFLGTLPPQRAGGTPERGGAADFLPRFNDALKAMASAKGAEIVDIYSRFPLELIGKDGLHPTEAGYERLAEIWFEAVKARYETAPEMDGSAARSIQKVPEPAYRAFQLPAYEEFDRRVRPGIDGQEP